MRMSSAWTNPGQSDHANRYRTFSALPDENRSSITPEVRSVFATAM